MIEELASTRDFRLAQDLIKAYQAARSGLITLGILRSERLLQGDYAEWIISQVLRLTLASSGVQKGFDAVDDAGRTYQVKSRIVASLADRTSFDMIDADAHFDFLIGVFFSSTLDVLAIIRIARADVTRLGSQTQRRFSMRWNRSAMSDPAIVFLYRAPDTSVGIATLNSRDDG